MVAFSLVVGSLLLLPADYGRLGQSAVAASLFLANIFFWWTVDYFAVTEIRPLIHTWSLAVEEQFYVFFPLILILLAKVRRVGGARYILPLVVLAIVSFAWGIWTLPRSQPDAFYLPHLRAWELLTGSLLALGARRGPASRLLSEGISFAGLALIVYAILTTDAENFPGVAALLPCLGAAFIIHSGEGSLVGRILGLWPLRFVGLISYSLYLWHWPLLEFARYYNITPLSGEQTALVVFASFVAAILSWRFVERPFRSRGWRRPVVFGAGAGATAIAVVAGAGIVFTDGAPGRFPPEILRYATMMEKELYYPLYDRGGCFLDYHQRAKDYDMDACASPADGTRILIWGDSFAANLYPGLLQAAEGSDVHVYQYTATSCRPMLRNNKRCDAIFHHFPEVVEHLRPHVVIMAGLWTIKMDADVLSARLGDGIKAARRSGAHVLVTGQSPTYSFSLPLLGFMYPEVRARDHVTYAARSHARLNQLLATIASDEDAAFYDFFERCSGVECTVFLHGEPLHWDFGHMTRQGSRHYTSALWKQLTAGALEMVDAAR